MFDVFGEVKRHVSISGDAKPEVNSSILYTMRLCMLCTIFGCVMVTARNFIGDNINCITEFGEEEHKAVENYCFVTGTFTVPKLSDEKSAHPGVGPVFSGTVPTPYSGGFSGYNNIGSLNIEEVQMHTYYQWVPIMLALQAGLYYLPVLLWKYLDKDFFETTLCQLHLVHLDTDNSKKYIAASSMYFKKTMRHHVLYALKYLSAEAFAVILAISNLFITNSFLGGFFFQYGPSAFGYFNSDSYDFSNPLNEIFPKIAKCTWHKFGPTGTIQTFDTLCVLPLNIVNEKTYMFLWIIYVMAAAVVGVIFLIHVTVFFVLKLREPMILKMPMSAETRRRLQYILEKGNMGDWFLLWNFRSHMMYFPEWVKSVHELISQ